MAKASNSLKTPIPANSSAPFSLSPSALATVAPTSFLQAHLSSSSLPIRPNGRTPATLRPISLNLRSLTHTNGSSFIRLGDTSVVCGVRAEILDVKDIANYRVKRTTDASTSTSANSEFDFEIWQNDLLVPNLELNTGCSPSHIPGNPPSSFAQSLSHRLLTLLRSSHLISASDLKIYFQNPLEPSEKPILKAYWTLYIDILVLSYGGSIFSASWLAMVAALTDTVLPDARWDVDLEGVICDSEIVNAKKVNLKGMPVPLSFVGFEVEGGKNQWVLLDSDEFEEAICGGESVVVVDKKAGEGGFRVLRIDKTGDSVVGGKEITEIATKAGERWEHWTDILKKSLGKD
ncbi:MAG: hypothetical protein Q9160_001122 [Pyrenula sp. 1 TL-2023]